jgi:hypothetical protein
MSGGLLGPPQVTRQIRGEKLAKSLALGVLSSDCTSSSAHGSAEVLAFRTRATRYTDGSPTVISQVVKPNFGSGVLAHIGFSSSN